MAAGDLTPGTRVETKDELFPGAYCVGRVTKGDVEYAQVWFMLPTATPGSGPFDGRAGSQHDGLHGVGADKWSITEHEDGTVTVNPSIGCGPKPDYYWHGYLERGVWREV